MGKGATETGRQHPPTMATTKAAVMVALLLPLLLLASSSSGQQQQQAAAGGSFVATVEAALGVGEPEEVEVLTNADLTDLAQNNMSSDGVLDGIKIKISGDSLVDDLTPLAGLTKVGGLSLFGSRILASLAPLENLTAIDGSLSIIMNEGLTTVSLPSLSPCPKSIP